MENIFSKNKISKLLILLIGENENFTTRQQLLNASILLLGTCYLTSLIINPILGISSEVTLINLIVAISMIFIFYFTRFKCFFTIPCIFFFLIIFISLSFNWFLNEGLSGSIPYFYLSCIALILFLTEKLLRKILLIIWIINITLLFIIEFYNPQILIEYSTRKQKFFDLYISFWITAILIMIIVHIAKRLYHQEKQNTIDIIEQYRDSSEKLKNEFQDKINLLSIREKEIFQYIINGKSNKEISEKLFITEETVKQHINRIYKKLGTKCRKDTINFTLEIFNNKK